MSGPRAKKWPKVNRGLEIVNYFTCDVDFSRGKKMTQSKYCMIFKLKIPKVNYFTCMQHFSCRWHRPPEVDLNGDPRISNPYCCDILIRYWPKVNRGLKIVNYFTCMRHFSCRWYRPPEFDLNGYPRISNPYCHDIQIRTYEWTQGRISKMTQSKSWIKNSKLFYMYAALLL